MGQSTRQDWRAYFGLSLLVVVPLGIYFVYPIRVIVVISLMTLLFTVILGAPVDYLARRGLGRGWGLLMVAVGLFLLLQPAQIAVNPLLAQARRLTSDLPTLLTEVQGLAEGLPFGLGGGLAPLLDPNRLSEVLQSSGLSVGTVLNVGSSAASLLSSGIVVLLTGLFAVLYPAPLTNGFVALFPAGRRQRVRDILGEVYETLQRWFIGQLADMAIMGLLSAITLWIIGVPYALLLGLISGILGFIPYVGFAISLIPPVLLALADNPINAVWVVIAYILLQQIEQGLIYPFLMRRAVFVQPAVVVFALFISSLLFGVAGLVLATPLAAASQVLVRRLWVEKMDHSGVDPNPPPKIDGASKKRPALVSRALDFLKSS